MKSVELFNQPNLDTLLKSVKDEEAVKFLIYIGETEAKGGKRAFEYLEVPVTISAEQTELQLPDTLFVGNKFLLLKKITASYGIGCIVAIKTTNDNNVYVNSAVFVGKWHDRHDIGYWEAEAEKKKYQKAVKAEMKEKNFNDRLHKSLDEIKPAFKHADNITKQYMLAKIINYLNS